MSNALVDNEMFVDFEETLAEDSNKRPLSPGQELFFEDSKCRDEYNRLLVVYHASSGDFDAFENKFIGTGGGIIYGKGFYFCDNTFDLNIYGNTIREFYLNLKNPFIWKPFYSNSEEQQQNLSSFIGVLKRNGFKVASNLEIRLKENLEDDGNLDTLLEMTCGQAEAQKYFIATGYDGIINLDTGDYVAFNTTQIKLCSNRFPTKLALLAS